MTRLAGRSAVRASHAHRRRPAAWVAGILCVVAACGGEAAAPPAVTEGSFAQLQRAVLTPSCAVAGCHVSTSAALSGDLTLTADLAYDRLVDVLAHQPNARRDGLLRVRPGKPDSSLLYQKLLVSGAHAEYGNTMPVGAEPLSAGRLAFVRQWIAAGAPRTGFVADSALLASATPQPTTSFTALPAPAPDEGIQVVVDPFTVAPNYERELFVYRTLGNTQPVYVNRIQTLMRPYSHHFVLYAFQTGSFPCTAPPTANQVRDIRNANGTMNILAMLPMACHVFLGGSMSERGDYLFPFGVALELPAQMGIDVNVHYVNRTPGDVPGEAYANFYTTPASQVQKVARALNMSNTSITIPAGRDTTIGKTFTVSKTTTVFALTSHMHALGTRFLIKVVRQGVVGETVYETTDWAHPAMLTLTTPLVLQPGDGLRSVVTWNNTTSQRVSFGLMSTNEMAIIFGYYY
jgi:hypothetical protein